MYPSDISSIASRHGIPASIVPEYAGDRTAAARAITAGKSKALKAGFLLTKIIAEKHRVVYGISSEEADKETETVEHIYEDNLEWSMSVDQGRTVHGSHPVAMDADAIYQDLRGKVVAADWADKLTEYLLTACLATPMREDGRIYWSPPSTLPKINALKAFLDEVGIALITCEIEPENRVVIQEAAQDTMEDQIRALQEEVQAFDGKQRIGTYKERMAQCLALRRRAIMYRDVLGVGIQDAEEALKEVETKVNDMMMLRQLTTYHRDGSATVLDREPEPYDPETEAAAF